MNDLVVMAKNAADMKVAQENLSAWVGAKVEEAKLELDEMNDNLAIARRSKWKTSGLQTAASRALKTFSFYEKIKAAVDAGYVIVPDFPIDIFAVRTEREYPVRNYVARDWDINRTQNSESPPIGAGDYISDQPEVKRSPSSVYEGGKLVTKTGFWSDGYKDVDFPVKTVRPIILEETSKALQLKIFDEVGIIGAGKRRQVVRGQIAGADPMVIGRVIFKHGYKTKRVSFLIAWWLNPSDLTV